MEMDIILEAIAAFCFLAIFGLAWRVLDWALFAPKRLEKRLRQQGFKGNPYRFLVGDVKESGIMLQEAMSKPMEFNNDIVPRLMPYIDKTIKTYGKNSFTWMGRMPRLHVLEPELFKEVLNHYRKFPKNVSIHNPLIKFLFTGVGSYEGDKWSKHRKVINPAFTLEKVKNVLPAFAYCYEKELGKWEQMISREGLHEVDVFQAFDVSTSDVISQVAFGSTYEEARKIFQFIKELVNLTIESMRDVYIPGWRFLPTKRNNRMKKINKEISDIMRNMISQRIEAMKATGKPTGNDLLSVLLESNFQEIQKEGNKKNVGLSIDEIIEECKLFYFVGQDTTGVTLTWITLLLCKHPEWQERAREEVFRTFGRNKPTYDELSHLKYVTMIVHEVLRLYPPAFDLNKVVYEDTKLGPYTIPAGTQIHLGTIMLHRDKSIWGEDAMEFNPMRFSDGVAAATKNQVAYIPFSYGPRYCVGQNFALLQLRLAVAMMLQRFSFTLSPYYVHAPFSIISLQPQFGAPVIFRKL
uniref:Secologanin synthase 3 n=1 Tax=Ophiorrhiza pumila TaxID=157934 RepID=A0A8F3BRG6_9GENT|nr:secologanin synthase 3 [Ophiorrhiza pumila]